VIELEGNHIEKFLDHLDIVPFEEIDLEDIPVVVDILVEEGIVHIEKFLDHSDIVPFEEIELEGNHIEKFLDHLDIVPFEEIELEDIPVVVDILVEEDIVHIEKFLDR
jgi:hypothetical protein